MPSPSAVDYDYLIIGSGFGGSVSALRLAEKGYRVAILEKGRRFRDQDFPRSNWNLRKYLWLPALKCFGIQKLTFFKKLVILSGTGVGGGSLVYANTLMQPGEEFFKSPQWKDFRDWRDELTPHYETAKKMLGAATNPRFTFIDGELRKIAEKSGKESTFRPTEVGVYFGKPGEKHADPYFGGEGPERKGCIFCGACMIGCSHGAKNTLAKNYLWLAEKKGARIFPDTEVISIHPLSENGAQGYEVRTRKPGRWLLRSERRFSSKGIILAGGVLGTLDLLLRCRDELGTLPRLSRRLGEQVRTNSESLLAVTELNPPRSRDYSEGIAISSIFDADDFTRIEPVRYPRGSNFMRLLAAPLLPASSALRSSFIGRLTALLKAWLADPRKWIRLAFTWEWANKTSILLIMQNIDNQMRFTLGGRRWFKRPIQAHNEAQEPSGVPHLIEAGERAARSLAKSVGGIPQSTWNEALFNIPITAHILGGCPMGDTPEDGVIDPEHRVYGYDRLYVCDGSAIPANLGVNPSLTITAMTERAMSFIPRAASSPAFLRKNR